MALPITPTQAEDALNPGIVDAASSLINDALKATLIKGSPIKEVVVPLGCTEKVALEIIAMYTPAGWTVTVAIPQYEGAPLALSFVVT